MTRRPRLGRRRVMPQCSLSRSIARVRARYELPLKLRRHAGVDLPGAADSECKGIFRPLTLLSRMLRRGFVVAVCLSASVSAFSVTSTVRTSVLARSLSSPQLRRSVIALSSNQGRASISQVSMSATMSPTDKAKQLARSRTKALFDEGATLDFPPAGRGPLNQTKSIVRKHCQLLFTKPNHENSSDSSLLACAFWICLTSEEA